MFVSLSNPVKAFKFLKTRDLSKLFNSFKLRIVCPKRFEFVIVCIQIRIRSDSKCLGLKMRRYSFALADRYRMLTHSPATEFRENERFPGQG